jgi:hypothetical protein
MINSYMKIFNVILKTGIYPKSWKQTESNAFLRSTKQACIFFFFLCIYLLMKPNWELLNWSSIILINLLFNIVLQIFGRQFSLKHKDQHSVFFNISRGVKQGDSKRPT